MTKVRGRPFAPGNTVGCGRPKGSRNKAQSPGQALLDEYAPHLMRKCIALALGGNLGVLRMCLDRISPARLDACLRMSLPPIKTAQDVNQAAEKVTQALGRGGITPTEGGKVMNILEGRARIMEKVLWESRLEKLEENMAAGGLERLLRGPKMICPDVETEGKRCQTPRAVERDETRNLQQGLERARRHADEVPRL